MADLKIAQGNPPPGVITLSLPRRKWWQRLLFWRKPKHPMYSELYYWGDDGKLIPQQHEPKPVGVVVDTYINEDGEQIATVMIGGNGTFGSKE